MLITQVTVSRRISGVMETETAVTCLMNSTVSRATMVHTVLQTRTCSSAATTSVFAWMISVMRWMTVVMAVTSLRSSATTSVASSTTSFSVEMASVSSTTRCVMVLLTAVMPVTRTT